MKNTTKRILTALAMVAIAGAAAWVGYVQYLAVAVALGMAVELFLAARKSKISLKWRLAFALFFALFIMSAWFVGGRPWIMLLLLLIISAADTGAWFFGCRFGGAKLWPSVSPNKTWTGQIAGIICGAAAGVMYGMLGTDVFLPSLMWIGIGVALLSQYGDLAASAIKRRLNIKDFSRMLPGHGGLLDRFDGWLFALPVVALAIL
jgi:phosphatidate cytidylyltransferase